MENVNLTEKRMPAEWEKQKLVLMSFPHEETDWAKGSNSRDLEAALSPFIRIAQAIAYGEALYIICKDKEKILFHVLFHQKHDLYRDPNQ